MRHIFHRVLTICALILAGAAPAVAQDAAHSAVVYKLDDRSTFQRGCFPPCMCPMLEQAPVRGTFRLVPAGVDPLFQHYDVTWVDWRVVQPGGTVLPVVGSGTFRIGGEVAIQEQLALDLAVGTEPTQHFDSGLVVPTVPFPLLDLTISIHGVYCYDTVFHVRARPLPKMAVDLDQLRWDPDPPASTYDVVRGDLGTLRGTSGDYRIATEECVANGLAAEYVTFTTAPAPGGCDWFLVRADGGSYDAWDTPLAASRDASINAAPASCP